MVVVLRDGLHQCQLLRMVMMAFDFFVVLQTKLKLEWLRNCKGDEIMLNHNILPQLH